MHGKPSIKKKHGYWVVRVELVAGEPLSEYQHVSVRWEGALAWALDDSRWFPSVCEPSPLSRLSSMGRKNRNSSAERPSNSGNERKRFAMQVTHY